MITIRINLLPYRQMRRARAQRLFALLAVAAVAAGIGVAALGQFFLTQRIASQESRNAFLQTELKQLDQRIDEIKQLKEKTQGLLERKEVVETLQSNRGESVRLFVELAKQLPDGLYLKSFKQSADNMALTGYAQSSARVATFMRSLEASEFFANPLLVEVKAAQVSGLRANEFSLTVQLQRPEPVKPKQAGKPGKP